MKTKENKELIIYSCVISFIIAFMFCLYEPIITYAQNINDFWFDLNLLFPKIIIFFFATFLLIFLSSLFLLLLFNKNKKIYKICLIAVFVVFLVLYIQGNYFINKLPVLNGSVIDYSKFNRATLGVDLYSSRTNVELQKQIALTQAGLYAQAINVAKLNSSAAANLYSANTVQRNVELTQSTIANNELAPVKKLEQNSNTIELLNVADKNSNSSNGFNPFKSSDEKSAKGEKEAELNNLFA